MSISARETYLEENPHIKPLITGTSIVTQVEGQRRTDGAFDETMSRIAEAHPNSPLADRYGKRSIKEVKTQELAKKWKKKFQSDSR